MARNLKIHENRRTPISPTTSAFTTQTTRRPFSQPPTVTTTRFTRSVVPKRLFGLRYSQTATASYHNDYSLLVTANDVFCDVNDNSIHDW